MEGDVEVLTEEVGEVRDGHALAARYLTEQQLARAVVLDEAEYAHHPGLAAVVAPGGCPALGEMSRQVPQKQAGGAHTAEYPAVAAHYLTARKLKSTDLKLAQFVHTHTAFCRNKGKIQ